MSEPEEGTRIDVKKTGTHSMEISVYVGEDLIYRHRIELNPELFDEDEAERIMKMWGELIKMQACSMGLLKKFAERFYRFFFEDEEE